MIFLPIVIFGLGLIIGSFLNVVILRLNTGRSIAKGRSACARCNTQLSWYELIPVFSFLGLRGKCKTCHTHISFQYPVVELSTGLLFLLLFKSIILPVGINLVSVVSFLGAATIASLFVVISVYDAKHKIIPDKILYPLMAMSLLSVIWRALTLPGFSFSGALFAGIVLAAPFFFIWFFSKGRAMGFGDVKLALPIGFLVGLSGALAVFFFSFWIGAVFGLLLMATTRAQMKSQIPFAPCLIIGLAIVSILGVTLQTLFPLWQ